MGAGSSRLSPPLIGKSSAGMKHGGSPSRPGGAPCSAVQERLEQAARGCGGRGLLVFHVAFRLWNPLRDGLVRVEGAS